MKKLSKQAFLEQFDPTVHGTIVARAQKLEATHIVCFECRQMDSSHFGERTAMMVGPSCTYREPADVQGMYLKDLPSQRQYPVNFTAVVDWE